MTIVASGSSLGAIVHPIMLNNTLHSRLGFGNAVRASAALISALLLAACVLMRPRLPPAQHVPDFWETVRRFGRDTPYVLATIGWVWARVRLRGSWIESYLQNGHVWRRVLLPVLLSAAGCYHTRGRQHVLALRSKSVRVL